MRTSAKGITLIKAFESLRTQAYRCPAGIPTIGFGHTAGVKMGDYIDADKATQLLTEDLRQFEAVVNRECPNINQSQFDALVAFSFNVGSGNFQKSSLLKKVKSKADNPAIRDEFMKWTKAGKVELAGLVRRRKAEADLYFS